MLNRLEGRSGAWGLHRMDWDGAAALGRKALCWFALAGATFLLCRVHAAFAMAFLAAALLAGRNTAALLAGCVAGGMHGSLQSFDLRLPIGAAIVLGGSIAWEMLRPGEATRSGFGALPGRSGRRSSLRPAPSALARSPNRSEAAVCSALAGLGALIPGLACAGEAILPAAAAAAAGSVAAVASAPFMRAGLGAGWGRRWLDGDERMGLFLLCGLLTAGLARLSPSLALCAGGALVQLLYPGGALAGVGLGGAMLAAGGDARLLAMACAGGATAQLCADTSRANRSVSACGAMLAAGLLLNATPVVLAGAGASCLMAAALPRAWAHAVARLARSAPAFDPMRPALRAHRESARRLRALGAAFGELAEGYLAPVTLPDERALIQRLRERLCAGCGGYEACWSGRDGADLLCGLIARAVALSGEAPLFEGEAPPELTRRCRRGRLIPERLQEPLEDFARARRDELKRGAENRLISAQFLQARQMLDGLAERQARPRGLRPRQAERAAAALERAGIETDWVMATGGGGVEIVAALSAGRWTNALARRAASQLARAFGRTYAAAGAQGREMRFVRRPALRVERGVACASREAGAPCGDSHLCCMLDDERLLVLISDGMGSGDAAARESAVVARLLGRFLRAGAPAELAVETVNALMLNRGGEDMFATVDMLVVNLSTGEARFTKLAACPTLIARGGGILRVEGGRLPLGILEKVQPGQSRARLMPGDVLLMASDGVADAAGSDELERLLLDGPGDMSALARRALDAAGRACEGGRRDDMTAVCLKIGSRE